MARRLLRPQFSAACRNVLQEAIKVVMCVIMYRFVNAFYGPSAAAGHGWWMCESVDGHGSLQEALEHSVENWVRIIIMEMASLVEFY